MKSDVLYVTLQVLLLCPLCTSVQRHLILNVTSLKKYIDLFNAFDDEIYPQYFTNEHAFEFLSSNIPLFDCPDEAIEKTYYFRWWTFRKHIKLVPISEIYPSRTGPFFVITEFLPKVSWAGLYNTISCGGAHHFREGRWLHNTTFLDDYARFWFREGNPRAYSFWVAHSLRAVRFVTGNDKLLKELYPAMVKNFQTLRETNFDQFAPIEKRIGLYLNTDNRDGMEGSIGGQGGQERAYRPTLNSYQYGEAFALSKIAKSVGDTVNADLFAREAVRLKRVIEEKLWDKSSKFFKVLQRRKTRRSPGTNSVNITLGLADVRELHGYTPWYFNIPGEDKDDAWTEVMKPAGFFAPFGLTTAEQRHPSFRIEYSRSHECLWNGPSWPYATSITLTALANWLNKESRKYSDRNAVDATTSLSPADIGVGDSGIERSSVSNLNPAATKIDRDPDASILSEPINEPPSVNLPASSSSTPSRPVTIEDYFRLLKIFAAAQKRERVIRGRNHTVPWIDEDINPYTGDWIARTILKTWRNGTWSASKGGKERGKDYNHSTFVDLIITGLIGLRPQLSDTVVINPLIPTGLWSYFCLDGVRYHGRYLTIVWDSTGEKYGIGSGFFVLSDGVVIAAAHSPQRIRVKLPPTSSE